MWYSTTNPDLVVLSTKNYPFFLTLPLIFSVRIKYVNIVAPKPGFSAQYEKISQGPGVISHINNKAFSIIYKLYMYVTILCICYVYVYKVCLSIYLYPCKVYQWYSKTDHGYLRGNYKLR